MTIDRIAPTRRPEGPAQGTHEWRTLLFMHWEVPKEVLRPLVPARLDIDTFEGKAYVGLVPFTMRNIRPFRWAPPVPWVHSFHETNVRTYVHLEGKNPGVFFFSLDAANSLAVRTARAFWHLPYFRARMMLTDDGQGVRYASERLWPDPVPAKLELAYTKGDPIPPPADGTLEHFLVERYFLYSQKRNGDIFRGQVHHEAYPVHQANVTSLSDSIVRAAGFDALGERTADYYSPGVDVEVFPLTRV